MKNLCLNRQGDGILNLKYKNSATLGSADLVTDEVSSRNCNILTAFKMHKF